MNYARHLGNKKSKVPRSGDLVFFHFDPPSTVKPLDLWAFYDYPAGTCVGSFYGRIIGEDRDARCARLGHAPDECTACRMEPDHGNG